MAHFAVIDTETNWHDEVMSIGMVIADSDSLEPVSSRCYIITPAYKVGGMFSHTLFFKNEKMNFECSRKKAIYHLKSCFEEYGVTDLFAYNASFDYRHLPELSSFAWYDIMKLAAYRQHNPKISRASDCYSTGRLKRDYGVEAILRLLSDDMTYCEQHNALTDALDELKIMKLLQHKLDRYVQI